jgi:hypothetical protein
VHQHHRFVFLRTRKRNFRFPRHVLRRWVSKEVTCVRRSIWCYGKRLVFRNTGRRCSHNVTNYVPTSFPSRHTSIT